MPAAVRVHSVVLMDGRGKLLRYPDRPAYDRGPCGSTA